MLTKEAKLGTLARLAKKFGLNKVRKSGLGWGNLINSPAVKNLAFDDDGRVLLYPVHTGIKSFSRSPYGDAGYSPINSLLFNLNRSSRFLDQATRTALMPRNLTKIIYDFGGKVPEGVPRIDKLISGIKRSAIGSGKHVDDLNNLLGNPPSDAFKIPRMRAHSDSFGQLHELLGSALEVRDARSKLKGMLALLKDLYK